MERLNLLVCLALICVASVTSLIDPRGARPVEPATRGDKCDTKKEWPFCTSDEWGPKCPSGCRIQGLMNKYDHSLLKRIEKIRSLLDQNSAKYRNADQVSKQTYEHLKEKLITDAGSDNSYYNLAQNLRQRITDMKIKIDRQLRILAALKDRVKDQVNDMQRLEVDIDIKLRSCKGSCESYSEYQVDKESYVALDKQINQLDSHSAQTIESVGTLFVMKSLPLRETTVETIYKSTVETAQQKEDMFPAVKTVHLILEAEGSKTSPATITKDQGTSFSHSTASSSSSSASSSASSSSSTTSKSITEIGGLGKDDLFDLGGLDGVGHSSTSHVSTKAVSCTKSIRRTVVNTKDGPVEKTEEVIEGGPECQAMTDTTRAGLASLFPSAGIKGGIFGGSQTDFGNPFGDDLGAFHTGRAEDDVPDFQARSVKSVTVERTADYVGAVCVRPKQQNQNGRQPCPTKSDVALCSDDDWVSKCPSGCRLHALISQTESDVERKLRRVCKTAKMCEDAAEKSMTAMTRVYNYNRRVIVNRYMSELKFVEHTEGLARNLTSLRKRSSELSQQLDELRRNVQKQVEDLYRTEVDVDVKLRACRGSCQSVLPHSVDHHSYRMLRTEMDQVEKRWRAAPPPGDMIPHIKLKPVDVGPATRAEYKSIPMVQRELLTQFEDIGQNRVVLEESAGMEGFD